MADVGRPAHLLIQAVGAFLYGFCASSSARRWPPPGSTRRPSAPCTAMLTGMASRPCRRALGRGLGAAATVRRPAGHHGRRRHRLRAHRLRAVPRPRGAHRHALDGSERVRTDHDRRAGDAGLGAAAGGSSVVRALQRGRLPRRRGRALAAGGPSALRDLLPGLPPDQRWLLLVPIGAAICVMLATRLSTQVEVAADRRPRRAACIAREASCGGWRRSSRSTPSPADSSCRRFMVYLVRAPVRCRCRADGPRFFGVGLLQAGSSVAAGWLGARIGLLNTMVFTHLPSNVLLALIAVAPTPAASPIGLLLARSALSQMDVPARQAYLAALVDPAERTAGGRLHQCGATPRAPGRAGARIGLDGMVAGLPVRRSPAGSRRIYDVAALPRLPPRPAGGRQRTPSRGAGSAAPSRRRSR